MHLTTIHHVNSVGDDVRNPPQSTYRESVYRVEDNDDVIRVTVHRDRYYWTQGYAFLERLTPNGEWVKLFIAERADVKRLEMWETENTLLESYGNLARLPFTHFDSEGALFESGHLTEN